MPKPIVVFNWKMNPETEAEALALFESTAAAARSARRVTVVVAPPFTYLASIEKQWGIAEKKDENEAVHLAAQDLFWENAGAYTGEISPVMERGFGVSYVIVGHSERRRILGETNAMVRKKLKKAFEMGLKPILCIGEAERLGNDIPASVGEELAASIADIEPMLLESLIVAYEPVWAIGTKTPDTPQGMHKAAIYIRKILSETYGEGAGARALVLYGGSVTSANVSRFLTETGGAVNGVLVGGASLNPNEVRGIIAETDRLA